MYMPTLLVGLFCAALFGKPVQFFWLELKTNSDAAGKAGCRENGCLIFVMNLMKLLASK